jgi:hypothetical protein
MDDMLRDLDTARTSSSLRGESHQATVAASVIGLGLVAQNALAQNQAAEPLDIALAFADPNAAADSTTAAAAQGPVLSQEFASLTMDGGITPAQMAAPDTAQTQAFPTTLGDGLFPFVDSRKQVARDNMAEVESPDPVSELTPTSPYIGKQPPKAEADTPVEPGLLPPEKATGGGLLDPILGEDGLIGGVIDSIAGDNGLLDSILGPDGLVGGVLDGLLGEDGLVDNLLDNLLGGDGLVSGVIDLVAGGNGLLTEDGVVVGVIDTVLGEDGLLGGVIDIVAGEGGLLAGDGGITGVIDTVLGDDGVLDSLLGQDGVLGGLLGEDGLLDNLLGQNGLVGGLLGGGGLLGLGQQQPAQAANDPAPESAPDVTALAGGIVAETLDTVDDLLGGSGDDGFLDSLLALDGDTSLLDGLLGEADLFNTASQIMQDASEFDLFAGLTGIDELSGSIIDQGLLTENLNTVLDDSGVDDLLTQILGSAVGGDALGGAGNIFAELMGDTDQTVDETIHNGVDTIIGEDVIETAVHTVLDSVNDIQSSLLGGLFGSTADDQDS